MNTPPMYTPDPELAIVADQVAFLFHVLVGVDPIGDFQAVENLSYSVTPFTWQEGGRNHSPHMLPFDGPGKAGELTLRWGMLIRTTLYDWMRAVQVGRGFRRDVLILQLDRRKIPVRLMRLRNAWPTNWQGANLSSTETSFAVESLTLVYEDMNLISNKLRVIPLPIQIGGEDLSEQEASDYQDEQERIDAMLEEAEATQSEEEARIEALRQAIEERRAAEEADKLAGQKAREMATQEGEASGSEFRDGWHQGSTRDETVEVDYDSTAYREQWAQQTESSHSAVNTEDAQEEEEDTPEEEPTDDEPTDGGKNTSEES